MIRFISTLCLLLLISSQASAAKHEGLGIASASQSMLPAKTWDNIDRALLHELISDIPLNLEAGYRDLARRMLLVRAAPQEWPEETKEKDDFLALRLEKLIQLGLFEDALALYQAKKRIDVPEKINKLGIFAALLLQKKELACLIIKAEKMQWARLEEHCTNKEDKSSDPEEEKSVTKSSYEDFKNASLENKAFFFLRNDIRLDATINLQDTQDLFLIRQALINETYNIEERLNAALLAEKYGIPHNINIKEALKDNDVNGIWAHIKTLQDRKSELEDKQAAFKALFEKRATIPSNFFRLISSYTLLEDLEITLTPNELFDLTVLYALHNKAFKNPTSTEKKVAANWPLLALLKKEKFSEEKLTMWINTYCIENNYFPLKLCVNLQQLTFLNFEKIEELDSNHLNYVKLFPLTKKIDYVMPIGSVVLLQPQLVDETNLGYTLLRLFTYGDTSLAEWYFHVYKAVLPLWETAFDKKALTRLETRIIQLWKEQNL